MRAIDVEHAGVTAVVHKNDQHPEQYLWITVGARLFFLGVFVDGMTRGDVRARAREFLGVLSAR